MINQLLTKICAQKAWRLDPDQENLKALDCVMRYSEETLTLQVLLADSFFMEEETGG